MFGGGKAREARHEALDAGGAAVVDQAELRGLTLDFLRLKVRFFPSLGAGTGHFLDRVLGEVKGADLRKQVCAPSRRLRRQAVGFLDSFVALLEKRQVRLVGRVWVKGIGGPFNGRAVYTSSHREDRGGAGCGAGRCLGAAAGAGFRRLGRRHPGVPGGVPAGGAAQRGRAAVRLTAGGSLGP